ncbi:MAG: ABC transporter substrate-binding protein [Spirochaetota bacterium]
MKRYLIGLSILSLVVFAFAGGQKESKSEAAVKPEVVTLTIIAPWAADELEGFKPVMAKFEEKNPNIRLEYRTGKPEDTATILAGQFAVQKTPADVIDTPWHWYIVEQAKKGHVLDVSDVIDPSDYLSGALEQVTVGGKIYGVSSMGGVTVPEYRKSFFEKNGLPDPNKLKTWNEFIALLDRIKTIPGVKAPIGSGNGVGWPFTSVVENWILTFGGAKLHQELTEGKVAWMSDRVRGILVKELLPLLQKGYFGEPDDFDAILQAMWKGEYGIYIGDSTDSMSVSPPEDRGVFLMPGQNAAVLWYDFWFAPKYTRYPAETKKLFKFLATEGQEIQVGGGGRISTYKKITPASYPPPEREVFELLSGKAVRPDMDDTLGGKFQSTIWDQLKLLWANPSEKTLDEILKIIQTAAEETLASK